MPTRCWITSPQRHLVDLATTHYAPNYHPRKHAHFESVSTLCRLILPPTIATNDRPFRAGSATSFPLSPKIPLPVPLSPPFPCPADSPCARSEATVKSMLMSQTDRTFITTLRLPPLAVPVFASALTRHPLLRPSGRHPSLSRSTGLQAGKMAGHIRGIRISRRSMDGRRLLFN